MYITLLARIKNIWNHINYLKSTNNMPTEFFHYLLFYMVPDTISIIISGITDLSL